MRDTRYEIGSALILTVVLTSLLAVIGVMFVMTARVDKMATSAISENRELNFAVETVVAEISQKLIEDVPGVAGQEYYDYPDGDNLWLASLEPYEYPSGSRNYYWRQISDVTGYFLRSAVEDVNAVIVGENDKITDPNNQLADADGDGVADSKWIELENIISNKGRPIYAAIRIIDNGGMININTVFANPGGPEERKGAKLTDIYIDGVVKTGTNYIDKFIENRSGDPTITKAMAALYDNEVSCRVENPAVVSPPYTLYDISEELSLRNRFIAYNNLTVTRLESGDCFGNSLRNNNIYTPVDDANSLIRWERRMDSDHPDNSSYEPNESRNLYTFRKLLTTYNMDRIIDPTGGKMLNITDANAATIYQTAKSIGIDQDEAAQIAVNLVDYRDDNSDVTNFNNPDDGIIYYGFEAQPFITEIGIKIDAGDPTIAANNHYAVELYNPFNVAVPLQDFYLAIMDGAIEIDRVPFDAGDIIDANSFFVIVDSSSAFSVPGDKQYPGLKLSTGYMVNPAPPLDFLNDSVVSYDLNLKRAVDGSDIILDRQITNRGWFLWDPGGTEKYVQRDDDDWRIVYQRMDDTVATDSLGTANTGSVPGTNYNLALANTGFVSIGDVARPLKIGPSTDPCDMIGKQLALAISEDDVRFDLTDPDFQEVFKYLTVFDPTSDDIDNDGDGTPDEPDELKVPGRININTAPWYVIAQLPWIQYNAAGYDYLRAQAIVADRDSAGAFKNIGELMRVTKMSDLRFDGSDNSFPGGPDITPDSAQGDFEERDVIFSRISNLVTVRSDVFTAYILVRIGADGPQKRVIAILDRSDVYSASDKVRIVALHPVPDPR